MSTPAQSLWQMDRDHFIHPYTDFATFREEGSQVITGAEGMYVSDSEGRRLLDGIAGLWCVNIGHGRREMAEAIAEQVLQMQYYNPFGHSTNAPGAQLAAKLAELAPGDLDHVFYTCGGSTANDAAIRLVHYYNNLRGKPEKKRIISRLDAYHGATYVAAGLTGIAGTKLSLDDITQGWVDYLSSPSLYRRPNGADGLSEADYCQFLLDEFENRLLQHGPETVAAFIAEPIMGAGGVLVAPKGYHRGMWALCQKYDVLYIADEVVTGFGRLGEWFVSETLYDYQPDILITAKGLTSGYVPLGAAVISSRIYDVISQPQCEGGVLSLGFTYSGHPVACAAALKNIEIMEREQLPQRVRENGPYFMDRARDLLALDWVGDVRGSHLMVGIELVADRDSKASFPLAANATQRVFERARDLGAIVRPVGNQIILSPPLIIDREQTDTLFSILRQAITEVCSELTDKR